MKTSVTEKRKKSSDVPWRVPTDDKSLHVIITKLKKKRLTDSIGVFFVYLSILLVVTFIYVLGLKGYLSIIVGLFLFVAINIWREIRFPPSMRRKIAASAEDYLFAMEDLKRWKRRRRPKYIKSSLYFLKHGEAALKNIPDYQELRKQVETEIASLEDEL